MRLKYICTSFSSALSLQEVSDKGTYKVYGASGEVGWMEKYQCNTDYLGIVKDGAGIGRVFSCEPCSSLLGTMAYIIPNNSINLSWLKYVISALNLGESVGKTTIPHIYFSDYGNRTINYVPPESQSSIGLYLEHNEQMIGILKRLIIESITDYKALKQSLITRAVTKGLDPNVEMKDSGIESIQQIPIEWEIRPLKHLMDILDQFRKPVAAEERNNSADILYDYYGASGIIDKIDGYTIDDHVLLIGEDGANLLLRNLPLVYELNGKAWVNNHAHILKPKQKMNFKYCFYALENCDITLYVTGSAQPKLTQKNLSILPIPHPPLHEQQAIADYLDEKCAEIDKLIEKKEQLLVELENYKKSLIYEYVTGKKEVPETWQSK